MKTFWCLALLVIIGLNVCHVAAVCPNSVECECIDDIIYCGFLNKIPVFKSPGADVYNSLVIHKSSLTTIGDNMLPSNLQNLYLIDTHISSVSNNAFAASSSTLEYLSIWRSTLTKLPDALRRLPALEGLEIGNAPMTEWNMDILKQLGPQIKYLYLNNVGLTGWPSWMDLFVSLEEIGFYQMPMNTLPQDAFARYANSLAYLDLHGVGLISVPNFPPEMSELESISFYENRISDLKGLPQMPKVTVIDFGKNNLTDPKLVTQALQPYSSTVSSLYLDDNPLGEIPPLAKFSSLNNIYLAACGISQPNSGSFPPTLVKLDLSSNSIPAFPSGLAKLNDLQELNLRDNMITNFSTADIPAGLQILELSNNSIAELKDASFPKRSALIKLYLNFNPLTKISKSAFANTPDLQVLEMNSAKLTKLPLSLSDLQNLQALSLNDNSQLVCTCEEAALSQWYLSSALNKVEGTCGEVHIYYFLEILAPGCKKA